jgi:hypothetical protein
MSTPSATRSVRSASRFEKLAKCSLLSEAETQIDRAQVSSGAVIDAARRRDCATDCCQQAFPRGG